MTAAPHRPRLYDDLVSKSGWRRVIQCRAVRLIFAGTLIASLAAIAFPGSDIRASEIFYLPGQGFPASKEPFFLGIRWLGRALPWAVVAGLAAALAVRLVRGAPLSWLQDRALAFVGLSMALGPGLLVNLVLKSHWGRMRPINTDVFGGSAPFTPAWWPWGACRANCSFVSGEASTAVVLLAFAFVAPRNWRPVIVVGSVLWTILISLNRMAFGAHYLSDVMISVGLTLLVIFVLKALILDTAEQRPPPSP